ncbi:hypothetical protein CANARDRAFT_184654, partial [[Candida] arabinofermentans NRRL YB-2248]
IEINGATLEYSKVTPKESNGKLAITLHGGRGFGSKEGDFSVYKDLANYGYTVISFDFRGHGNSSSTPPFIFKQIVEDIEALKLHFSKDEKIIVIGGSFGSFLAQQYAITYPDSISHLVLRGAAPSYHQEDECLSKLANNLKTGKASNASVEMVHKVFSSFESDEEMKLIMFALAPLYVEVYDQNKGLAGVLNTKYNSKSHNDLYSETEKYFDYRDDLKRLEKPTLIIVGANDWICPPEQSELIHSLIKDSKLLVIPDANHSVHVEKKEIVIAEIVKFL